MDEIDANQQKEIEELKRIDVRHESKIDTTRWITWALFIFVTAMFAVTMTTLENSGPYSCPHKECPHFKGSNH